MAKRFAIRRNFKLNPTFREGQLVFLTKDCPDHTDLNYDPVDDPESVYFKTGCAFTIVQCGESKYSVSATGEPLDPINPISDEEWCIVAVIDEELDEEYYIDGIVRAKDLREAVAEDF